MAKNADRLHFTTDMGEVLEPPSCCSAASTRRRSYSGDADLSRVETVVEEIGDSSEHAIVMKSTVPVGHRARGPAPADGLGYVSNPEFLQGGHARSTTS